MSASEKIKKLWPDATLIHFVGYCDSCNDFSLYFFTRGKMDITSDDEFIMGGYYCDACKFSNAGAFHSKWLNQAIIERSKKSP